MKLAKTAVAVSIAMAASSALAGETDFDRFRPMVGDAGEGALPEAAPYRLASKNIRQISVVVRGDEGNALPGAGPRFDSGNYDMHTLNESGPDAGRYLFSVFETGQAGIQRTDLKTMITTTIWHSPAPGGHRSFDASRWTPWGTFITAEESWSDPGANPTSQYGRLFEVTNPLADPADINIVHRDILPRVSHEGTAFDRRRNFYFIDERNGSHIFKYTSKKPWADNGDDYFAAGQTFVLRVGDGTEHEATGQAGWIALTDESGQPLPGTVVVTDPNGLTALDGRATPKEADFLGTAYDRPEDLEIRNVRHGQILFVATTTNHKVFAIDLRSNIVRLAASRDTIDMATGLPVGEPFRNPDNLAIDAEGNIYIIEDRPGGEEDIWFMQDRNDDGVAEAIGKWASLTTAGAESTGLYFNPFKPNQAFINVQHPASGVDRTIMLEVEKDAHRHWDWRKQGHDHD